MKRTLIGAAVAAAAILGGTAVGQGYGMGPGMMGGGYGPGYGMGPGMMGGYGPGQGMGPGMMGGYGPGQGMGPGMMGGGYGPGYAALNLTDEQRKKIDAIQEEVMGELSELIAWDDHDTGLSSSGDIQENFRKLRQRERILFGAIREISLLKTATIPLEPFIKEIAESALKRAEEVLPELP